MQGNSDDLAVGLAWRACGHTARRLAVDGRAGGPRLSRAVQDLFNKVVRVAAAIGSDTIQSRPAGGGEHLRPGQSGAMNCKIASLARQCLLCPENSPPPNWKHISTKGSRRRRWRQWRWPPHARPESIAQLAGINRRRDAGMHSLGEIWRRRRLSCPSRDQLGSYLMSVLDEGEEQFIRFHIEVSGCRICAANLDDLRRRQAAPAHTTRGGGSIFSRAPAIFAAVKVRNCRNGRAPNGNPTRKFWGCAQCQARRGPHWACPSGLLTDKLQPRRRKSFPPPGLPRSEKMTARLKSLWKWTSRSQRQSRSVSKPSGQARWGKRSTLSLHLVACQSWNPPGQARRSLKAQLQNA